MTVYISGNSHVVALADGLKEREAMKSKVKTFSFGVGTFELEPMSKIQNGHVEFARPVLRKRLRKATGDTQFKAADRWGFVMGTHNVRLYGNDIWQSCALARAWIPGSRPISEGVLMQMIHADQQHIKQFLLDLKETGVDIFVVSCPSPRRDGAAAKRGVPLETIALIDTLARRSFIDWLNENAIDFIPEPDCTVDNEGFLKPEFARQFLSNGKVDPHHANSDYGALMLDEIENSLDAPLEIERAVRHQEPVSSHENQPTGLNEDDVASTQRSKDISRLIKNIAARHSRIAKSEFPRNQKPTTLH